MCQYPQNASVHSSIQNTNDIETLNSTCKYLDDHLSLVRTPVFGVSDQVPHKSGCAITEDGWRLEISDLGSRGNVLFVLRNQIHPLELQLNRYKKVMPA